MKRNIRSTFTRRTTIRFSLVMLVLSTVSPFYAQNVYMFTNCGATGRFGPNQGQVNAAYQTTNLNGQVTSSNGIQLWTVPTTGNYDIEATGAAGGCEAQPFGGKGVTMKGTFNLTAGTVLKIIVGQKGLDSTPYGGINDGGGGGGGSFVCSNTNVPMIIAGGGGGKMDWVTPTYPSQVDAFTVTTGGNTNATTGGGANGNGGNNGITNGPGAGGGGLLTDGVASSAITGGQAFVNGGVGGDATPASGGYYGGDGGFGGGGGAYHNSLSRGGGGGGYSGGQGGTWTPITPDMNGSGGGGGSFNSGTNQVNTVGTGTAHGWVKITELCNVAITANHNPICIGDNVTLNTNASTISGWSPVGGTAPSVVVSPTVSTSYSVTGTGINNCISTAVIVVTVVGLPTISGMVVPSILCAGSTASIIGMGGASYTWSSGAPGLVTTVSPASSTVYNFTGSNVFGCVSSASVMVHVNTNSLVLTPNTTICMGKSAQISANGASTYTWNNGAMLPGLVVSPSVNTTYIVNATDANNCALSGQVQVNVSPLPNVVASASKDQVCPFEPVTLTASGADTYTWSNSQTGASIPLGLPSNVVYSYTVTGTSANGCNQSAVVTVTVNRCVGINEENTEFANVALYPNPSSGQVSVTTGNTLPKTLEIMDLTGKVVLTTTSSEDVIPLSVTHLAGGLYYVKVRSEGSAVTLKLVKH